VAIQIIRDILGGLPFLAFLNSLKPFEIRSIVLWQDKALNPYDWINS
jgi:hypothetical protein